MSPRTDTVKWKYRLGSTLRAMVESSSNPFSWSAVSGDTPNPSLHPNCYSGLGPLAHSDELVRRAPSQAVYPMTKGTHPVTLIL